ncbi:MAG: IS3 family transposase [Gemmataceae bacterium]
MYAAVEAIARDTALPTATVCNVLDVSRSAYYAWYVDEPTSRGREDVELGETVRTIFWTHRRRYGARRIASELSDRGMVCSPRRVAKLLKIQDLRAIQPKSFVPKTTDSRHGLGYSPNLLLDASDPTRPNELWVGDITYLPLRRGGFCYLAGLMDRFTRDIVGWHVDSSMEESLTLATLRGAIRLRQPGTKLIHHTDRGGQYAGHAYRAVLRRAGMRQSMSRAGNCYDNAFMESCWGTFKTEMENADYDSEEHARRSVAEYVEYYRFDRKHSSLDYLTPNEFFKLHAAAK